MKRHPFPYLSPTVEIAKPGDGAVSSRPTLWGIAGYSDAPCRNRTCNLMIKSQLQGSDLARTEGVYLGFQATNNVELVPPVDPKSARQFPLMSHGVAA